MNKNWRNILTMTLCVMIVMSMFGGCSKKPATNTAGTTEGTTEETTKTEESKSVMEPLKEVKLKAYLISWATPYADNTRVMEEINKILKEKINATLEVTVDLAADAAKKIPLMLASGEDYDLMSMDGSTFATAIAAGGLMELDELLPKYMPERMEGLSKKEEASFKFDDKYYKVPGGFDWFLPQGWLIRGDLRKKYNIPEVKDIDGLQVYMDVLKEKEPGVIPFNTSASDVLNLKNNFVNAAGYMNVFPSLGMFYDFNSDEVTVQYEYELEEFKDYLNKAKEFTDKGYWSKNAYASKNISNAGFKAGTSFVATGHSVSANDTAIVLKTEQPSWEVEFVRIPDYYRQKTMRAGTGVIPKSSKNPERMLMALELLRTDPELNALLEYGIEGVHYKLSSDGKIDSLPEGSEKYPIDQLPLAWGNRNKELWKSVNGGLDVVMDIQATADETTQMSKLYGFSVDKTSIVNEIAAMSEIYNTYKPIFDLGGLSDIDASLKECTEKMKLAGSDKVKEEIQRQVDEFLKKVQE